MTVTRQTPVSVHAVDSATCPVLVAGRWKPSCAVEMFVATNPATGDVVGGRFPVSGWEDVDAALASASGAAMAIRELNDSHKRVAQFFESYAGGIEQGAEELAAMAEAETGLSASARFIAIEIPRTVRQLRLASTAALDQCWRRPIIDTQNDIRSCLAPLGPVFVVGPNNFPFAFNGISGGDFVAALVAGNPVVAKGHPLHPNTTRALAQIASVCADDAGLPVGTVQLLFHMASDVGIRLIEDPRLKAVAFTGSRRVGLSLKAAADRSGKPFFGELSSLNPVVILPGALAESASAIAEQFTTSVLAGSGQFCTKPGLVILMDSESGESFVQNVAARMDAAAEGLLLSEGGARAVQASVAHLMKSGAHRVTNPSVKVQTGVRFANTLLRVSGDAFLSDPECFQTEAFGNVTTVVVVRDALQLVEVIESLEGNLTGSIYSSVLTDVDEPLAERVSSRLRPRVGRLLNDKMPTGVAVSPAMNHGGPFPASTQPHFTAVGIPTSIQRFTQLECFEKVRQHRLPSCLKDYSVSATRNA